MNVDTDTQYAFTRPIAGHMFGHYDGVLKIDGEVGDKKAYDPRTYLKLAEQAMAVRVDAGLRGPAQRRHPPRPNRSPSFRAAMTGRVASNSNLSDENSVTIEE